MKKSLMYVLVSDHRIIGNRPELRLRKELVTGDVTNLTGWANQIRGFVNHDLRGDVSGIEGDVTDLFGDVSNLTGSVTGIYGNVSGIRGDASNIHGNVSRLRGDVTNLKGDVSGLVGDVSNVWGEATGISGDVDSCEIDNSRARRVHIVDLVLPEGPKFFSEQ